MQIFTLRKSAIRSRQGLVAAQNGYAAEAGAAVLAGGGNAMDAAIVTALVLSVVEPWLSGIGGGGFLLHADGSTGVVSTLDFNVIAPAGLDPNDYPLTDADVGNWFNWPAVEGDRNVSGYSSICTPGAVAGFAAALERLGTISWAEAVQPAIEHAERGLEVDWFASLSLAIDAAALAKYPASAELFLDDGRAPRASDREAPHFRPMPAKAHLLKRLAKAGARDFYEGEVARVVAHDLEAGGSAIRLSDLAGYQPMWREPHVGHYRQFEVNAISGLSGGPTFLDACERLSAANLSTGTSMADAALAYAVAIRDAYHVRLTTMGHAARPEAGCTTHVSVVDASGSMVSLTNTLLSRFGSKVVLPNAGILMNNGIMWFDPRPNQPNSIAPGVKPLANMCPLILKADGMPYLAIGAAGGRTIFPTVLQLVSYMVDFGLSLEDAFHTPRIDASTPTIKVNARAEPDVVATIGAKFPVEIVEDTLYPVNFAIPSAVMREASENVGMAHPTSPWAAVAIGGQPMNAEPRSPEMRDLLSVEDLRIKIAGINVVDGVSLSAQQGKILAIVGESGCGKSLTALSILRLLPKAAQIAGGHIYLEGDDLTAVDEDALQDIRGNRASIIFQEPIASLNPLMRVGTQVQEALMLHRGLSSAAARQEAIAMLSHVGIPDPERRARQYPFELSGGMCQRVMIAAALICRPRLLIADEPTTALDVTIQAQILDLMKRLRDEVGTTIIIITHDMGVVAEMADDVAVMYGGRVIESGPVDVIFAAPAHPYTRLLLETVPKLGGARKTALRTIVGMVPSAAAWPEGCRFRNRCPLETDVCKQRPALEPKGQVWHRAECWHSDRVAEIA